MPPHAHRMHAHTCSMHGNNLTETGMRTVRKAWGTRGGILWLVYERGHHLNVGFSAYVKASCGKTTSDQTTTQIGIPGNFVPDPSNVSDVLISTHGFTPEEAIAAGHSPSFVGKSSSAKFCRLVNHAFKNIAPFHNVLSVRS